MANDVYDFLANLKYGGARSNLFRVLLTFPLVAITTGEETKKTSFLCKSASLPASTQGVIEVPWLGRRVKIPGDKTFEEWTITCINDNDFMLRDAFERWNNAINSHRANIGEVIPQNIMTKASIEQLDRAQNVVKTYDMIGIWPSNVGAIEMSYESGDAVEEFPVTLQYQFWESNTTS